MTINGRYQSTGKAVPSLASALIDQGMAEQYDDDLVKHISATLCGGGADTVRISICLVIYYQGDILCLPTHSCRLSSRC